MTLKCSRASPAPWHCPSSWPNHLSSQSPASPALKPSLLYPPKGSWVIFLKLQILHSLASREDQDRVLPITGSWSVTQMPSVCTQHWETPWLGALYLPEYAAFLQTSMHSAFAQLLSYTAWKLSSSPRASHNTFRIQFKCHYSKRATAVSHRGWPIWPPTVLDTHHYCVCVTAHANILLTGLSPVIRELPFISES